MNILDIINPKQILANLVYNLVEYRKKQLSTHQVYPHAKNNIMKQAHIYRNENEINKGNRIVVVKNDNTEVEVSSYKNYIIKFHGKNSLVKIYESSSCKKLIAHIGDNSYIELGKFSGTKETLNIFAPRENSTIVLRPWARSAGNLIISFVEPNLEVIIGHNCLLANGVICSPCDGHTITDAEDKTKILNQPRVGCHIGDHCWIGTDVIIAKDADIPNDCVVGRRSFVNNTLFEPNCIIAGSPAKIVKRNIAWSHSPIHSYQPPVK